MPQSMQRWHELNPIMLTGSHTVGMLTAHSAGGSPAPLSHLISFSQAPTGRQATHCDSEHSLCRLQARLDFMTQPPDSPLLVHPLEGDSTGLGAVKVAHRLICCSHGCVRRLGLCSTLLQPHRVWNGL